MLTEYEEKVLFRNGIGFPKVPGSEALVNTAAWGQLQANRKNS